MDNTIDEGLDLIAAVLSSCNSCNTMSLTRSGLGWNLDACSCFLLHFLDNTALSSDAQTNIMVWNLEKGEYTEL